jgi:intracellular multiplication protein IcmD
MENIMKNLVRLNSRKFQKCSKYLIAAGAFMFVSAVLADGEGTATLGSLAANVRGTFTDVAQLMMGIAYVAGIGFFIGAIFKFKQHKDNPTQIPMGTPIALLVVAVCLVFMPYIIQSSGATFTGGAEDSISGPDGTLLPGGFGQ